MTFLNSNFYKNSILFFMSGFSVDLLTFILLAILVFFASFLASWVGLGGGVFYVPILVLLFGFSIKEEAVPLSLAMVLATSIGATITYHKDKKVVVKLGLFLAPAVLIGVIIGVYFHLHADETTLLFMFSLVLFFTSIKIFASPKRAYDGAENGAFSFSREKILKKHLILALFVCFLAGFFSASLGIGGGVLFTPVLYLVLCIPMRHSVGTSSFMIVFTTTLALILHGSFGEVDVVLAFPLAVVTFFGAFSGSRFALIYVKVEFIRELFAIILFFVAIRMFGDSVF